VPFAVSFVSCVDCSCHKSFEAAATRLLSVVPVLTSACMSSPWVLYCGRYAGDSVGSLPAVLSPADALMTLPSDGALRIYTYAESSGASAAGIRIPAGAAAPAGMIPPVLDSLSPLVITIPLGAM
jgi:hypothetical protein